MQYGIFTFESYMGSKVGHDGAPMFVSRRVTTSISNAQSINRFLWALV
jgi:hypothetical protein